MKDTGNIRLDAEKLHDGAEQAARDYYDKCQSKLNERVWAIILSDRVVAYNLTYNEAAEQIKSLNGYEATIVTNDVARRMDTSLMVNQWAGLS